jgi:hypothetical protein
MYTVRFRRIAITTALGDHDFFELTPADDKPIELAAVLLSFSSELGEAQEEWIDWGVVRGNATTGNGTATTPAAMDPRDNAAGFTAKTVSTTPASAGTAVETVSDNFNVRSGLQIWLPEGYRPRVDQADTMMCVRMFTAVADDVVCSGTAWVKEC